MSNIIEEREYVWSPWMKDLREDEETIRYYLMNPLKRALGPVTAPYQKKCAKCRCPFSKTKVAMPPRRGFREGFRP
jgi:hypothetical protein